jgi:hypothetical protein
MFVFKTYLASYGRNMTLLGGGRGSGETKYSSFWDQFNFETIPNAKEPKNLNRIDEISK